MQPGVLAAHSEGQHKISFAHSLVKYGGDCGQKACNPLTGQGRDGKDMRAACLRQIQSGAAFGGHEVQLVPHLDLRRVGFDPQRGQDIGHICRLFGGFGVGYVTDVQDQVSLQAALDVIGGRTLTCDYALTQIPPDPSKLFVFFDRVQVLKDPSHLNGWDYDSARNQVKFYGAACAKLKAGQVAKLDIVYGCPGIN